MLDFLKFMLKCIWHIGPVTEGYNPETDGLYLTLGLIGFFIFDVFLGLICWYMWKSKKFVLKSGKLEIAVAMLLSLIPTIVYFFIAYCLV